MKEQKNQDLLNSILDKINDEGIESLTPYEKNLLDHIDQVVGNKDEDVLKWLEGEFGNMQSIKRTRPSIGRQVEEIIYLKNNQIYIEYEVSVKAMGVSRNSNIAYLEDSIWKHLYNYFGLTEDEAKKVLSH